MKCEICHKNEAQVAVERLIDGTRKELYVCKRCAVQHPPKSVKQGLPPFASVVNLVLDATAQAIKHGAIARKAAPSQSPEFELEKTCPNCGTTAKQVTNGERLGCPQCYETFASEIRILLDD